MGDLSKSDRRSLLERYHAALSGTVEMTELIRASSKYAGQTTIQSDRERIFQAHLARIPGQSSPAETDARVRQIIEGKDKA